MASHKHFVVVGLGSFGSALARKLAANGCRVSGIDDCPQRVETLRNELYEAIIGDATEREALQHLPVADVEAVFISTGEDITRSLLAALHAKELGARRIVVKGVSAEHGKLLRCLGVERVIFPEIEIAEQLADRMTWSNVLDFLPIDSDHSLIELAVPDALVGRTLEELNIHRRYGAWIVGVKDVLTNRLEMFPDGSVELGADQMVLAIGKQQQLEQFRDAFG